MAKFSSSFAATATAILVGTASVSAFSPAASITSTKLHQHTAFSTVSRPMIADLMAEATTTIPSYINQQVVPSYVETTSNLLSFSDQGQNLAGIFFQASLLPYLTFLYFLSFRGNRTPDLGNFGFQYLLLFVLGTIPSGIITKSTYGESLANVDWLHGGAEALLTITNVLIVLGFREAMTNPDYTKSGSKFGIAPKIIGGIGVILFAVACALGTGLGFQAHSPFLFGAGNLPEDTVISLPFGKKRLNLIPFSS